MAITMPASLVAALVLAARLLDPSPLPPTATPTPGNNIEHPVALPSGGTDFRRSMLAWSKAETALPAEALALPIQTIRISSAFGPRTDPIRGNVRTHRGIDLPDPIGTPVYAAASGIVVFAGLVRGYGNLVQIDHGNGGETRYAHLSAIAVSVGDRLNQRDQIGAVGSTGRSTGAHLHFEVRQDGTPLDPLLRLDQPFGAPAAGTVPSVRPHWNGYSMEAATLPQSRLR